MGRRDWQLKLADGLGWIWQLLPENLRRRLLFYFFVVESRGPHSADALRRLFAIRDCLDLTINERAMIYGKGVHPKHRLMDYHRFFIDRLPEVGGILDIGCGYGAVSRSIAVGLPNAKVVGIDNDAGRLNQARSAENPPNLTFVEGDATISVPEGSWTAVVLSNVLEHVSSRIAFLTRLQAATGAKQFLIRVPLFERDWQMPLRREVGASYLSDPDHKIEHTLAEFHDEVAAAGLKCVELRTLWGEIWADCRTADSDIGIPAR